MKKITTIITLLAAFVSANAQVNFPAASPHSTIKQTVGLTEVEIDYSRPGVKNREIFGGLVPFDEIWRTGANSPTKLTFSKDVTIADTVVPAGSYSLYTIPGKDEWTVIIYNSTEGWGAFGYDQEKDLLRFTAKAKSLEKSVETFTITVGKVKDDSAKIYLAWDNTKIGFKIHVNTHDQVMAQLETGMSGDDISDGLYFQAASYYHANDGDINQALVWINAALAKRATPPYWMLAKKAQILAASGDKKAALQTATTAKAMALENNNPGMAYDLELLIKTL